MQDLVGISVDDPGTADVVIVLIMTRVVGVTEGASWTSQVTTALLLCDLAEWAGPRARTGAGEAVDFVHTGASVQTRAGGAFVYVLVTVRSVPARTALTYVTRSCAGGHTLAINTRVAGLAEVAGLSTSTWTKAVSRVTRRTGAGGQAGSWDGGARGQGRAASVVGGTYVGLGARPAIALITWRTGPAVEGAHGVETLHQWSGGAAAVVAAALIHVLTAVAVPLPASRTGSTVEGALSVEARHRGVSGAGLVW